MPHNNTGERNGMSKLTDRQRRDMLALIAEKQSQAEIAERFGVTQCAVSKVVAAEQARALTAHMTQEECRDICAEAMRDGEGVVRRLIREHGITLGAARRVMAICRGRLRTA